MSDLATTRAPVSIPLRDWLRTAAAAIVDLDNNTPPVRAVYAGGRPSTDVISDTAKVISLHTVGGIGDDPYVDQVFVQFDCWAAKGHEAEAVAYSLRSLLEHTHGVALGAGLVLAGATCEPPIWSPDPDDGSARYIVTATCSFLAVST